MRIEPTLSSSPAPEANPEPIRKSTYSIESVLVPKDAPTFPYLSRFFHWLWSIFTFFIPKKKVEDSPPDPTVLKTIKEGVAKANAPTPIDLYTKRMIVPAALCGAAVAWHYAALKSESLARTQMWVGEQQGPLVIGALLGGKILVQLYDYVCPLVRNPGGILERQVSYKRAALVAGLLYAGYKVTDFESVLPPLVNAASGVAKYVWENQFVQTPLGLRIPFIGKYLWREGVIWEGAVPLVAVVKLTTSTSVKASNWIAGKMPNRVVKEAAKVTQLAAQTIDELSASIGTAKMGLGILSFARDTIPSLISTTRNTFHRVTSYIN